MLTSDKAKEIVIDSVKRIVQVEDAENWLQHNQTAYQLAMDVALNTYYQAKDEEAERFKEKVAERIAEQEVNGDTTLDAYFEVDDDGIEEINE